MPIEYLEKKFYYIGMASYAVWSLSISIGCRSVSLTAFNLTRKNNCYDKNAVSKDTHGTREKFVIHVSCLFLTKGKLKTNKN